MTAVFRAGGLASGLDTNTIIEQLIRLESRPLDLLKERQAGLKVQVSALGEIASKLSALDSATSALAKEGVVALQASSTNTAFTATPNSTAIAGRYSIEVSALASAAKARSQLFSSASAPVMGGTLHLVVMGETFDVQIADGATLADVAVAINASGAPVSAVVLSDGTGARLSITNRDTGYPIGGVPGDALSITESSTGVLGQPLAASVVQAATNAQITVDGLTFVRTSNTPSDVVPGTILSLKTTTSGVPEDLVLTHAPEAATARVQRFVDAFNDVARLVEKQLAAASATNRSRTLAGDSTVRSLQSRLRALVSRTLGNSGTVRTLADIGVKSARDGTLSIDAEKLSAAIERDPQAVNALFSSTGDGLGAVVAAMVKDQVNSADGLLSLRTNGLNRSIEALDDEMARLQVRIDKAREQLVRRFTAMEKVISGLRAIGNLLDRQAAQLQTGADL